MNPNRFAFCASTGRTATMFVAATLNSLTDVVGLHEGHVPGDPPVARLPLINLHNREAWYAPERAGEIVAQLRDRATLSKAASDAALMIDVAFYNAPLLDQLAGQHPGSELFVIIRRCEGFVRSATIVSGEDRQPAGWPDRRKPLSDRERFISLGRLKPKPGSDDAEHWAGWSAIQRNVWLWHSVNAHLLRVAASRVNCHVLQYESLVHDPGEFWSRFLERLDLFSGPALDRCVRRSARKLNERTSYQIGAVDSWSEVEIALYERLAHPLENEIYG